MEVDLFQLVRQSSGPCYQNFLQLPGTCLFQTSNFKLPVKWVYHFFSINFHFYFVRQFVSVTYNYIFLSKENIQKVGSSRNDVWKDCLWQQIFHLMLYCRGRWGEDYRVRGGSLSASSHQLDWMVAFDLVSTTVFTWPLDCEKAGLVALWVSLYPAVCW